jgi:hypothetical protein
MNKRMDFTIKRLVKIEDRMELFDRKLEQSVKDQKEFSKIQSQINKYFMSLLKKNNQ